MLLIDYQMTNIQRGLKTLFLCEIDQGHLLVIQDSVFWCGGFRRFPISAVWSLSLLFNTKHHWCHQLHWPKFIDLLIEFRSWCCKSWKNLSLSLNNRQGLAIMGISASILMYCVFVLWSMYHSIEHTVVWYLNILLRN